MNLNTLLGGDTEALEQAIYSNPTLLLSYELISIIFSLALFLLKGYALYTMGKRRSFDKLWMAYVPFLNFILLGKLVGKVVIWGKEVKNLGLLVCIATAVSTLIGYAIDFGYYVYMIELAFNVDVIFASDFIIQWVAQSSLIWVIAYYIYLVVNLIEVVLTCWIIFTIFRKYAPERSFIYSLVAIFFDFTFPIILFMIRKNEVSTFDDFLRMRNRYNNQNPNNYGGYNQGGNGYYNNPTPPANEIDPFPEFSDKPKNTNNGYPNENPYANNNQTNNNNTNDDDLFN